MGSENRKIQELTFLLLLTQQRTDSGTIKSLTNLSHYKKNIGQTEGKFN